jgi:hypothetical protein
MRTNELLDNSQTVAVLETANRQAERAPPPSRADMLEYMADMLLDLKQLSGRLDCPMLFGLLDLAQREAGERSKFAAQLARHNTR